MRHHRSPKHEWTLHERVLVALNILIVGALIWMLFII